MKKSITEIHTEDELFNRLKQTPFNQLVDRFIDNWNLLLDHTKAINLLYSLCKSEETDPNKFNESFRKFLKHHFWTITDVTFYIESHYIVIADYDKTSYEQGRVTTDRFYSVKMK